jgi:hypothetical protein
VFVATSVVAPLSRLLQILVNPTDRVDRMRVAVGPGGFSTMISTGNVEKSHNLMKGENGWTAKRP